MRIDREDLLKALTAVSPGLASKEIIEQSDSFVFTDGKVFTYNDEVTVSAPLDLGLEDAVVVPSRQLLQLLAKMPDDVVEISVEDSVFVMKGKRKRATINIQNEVILPVDQIERPKKWKPLKDVEGFLNALSVLSGMCSKDHTRQILTCVHVSPAYMEASDNYQICRYTHDYFPFECLVPAKIISHLKGASIRKANVTNNWVHFLCEASVVFSFRRIKEQYPDIGGSGLLKHSGTKFTIPDALKETLERAGIFSNSSFDTENVVQVIIDKSLIQVKAQNELSEYSESIKAKSSLKEPISFEIHPRLLQECQSGTKACVTENTLSIKTERFQYVATLTIL